MERRARTSIVGSGRAPALVCVAALLAFAGGCAGDAATKGGGEEPAPVVSATADVAPTSEDRAESSGPAPDAAATRPLEESADAAEELARREAELRAREEEIARREALAAREAELAERERLLAARERVAAKTPAEPMRETPARENSARDTTAPVEVAAEARSPSETSGDAGEPDTVPEPERAVLVEPGSTVEEPARDEELWNESWRTRGRDREDVSVADEAAEAEAAERRAALERLRAGTSFEVEIEEALSSGTNRVGDTFRTTVTEDVRDADGALVVPAGSVLWGEVIDARPLRRVGGQATLALEFRTLELSSGERVELRARFVELGRNKKKDKAKIAGAAIAGAILGRILGDGEAAAVGAAVGAAAGTAAVMSAEGREVEIPEGTVIALELEEVVTVTTRYGEPLR
jgi:hypothetical protein